LPTLLAASSATYMLTISAASACAWTATADVAWADIAPGSGRGNGTATLRVDANSSFDSRTMTVRLNGQSFRVPQNGVTCSYSVTPASLDLGGDGGAAAVTVSAISGCGWTATATESWLQVLTPSGSGSGTVRIDVAPNPGDVRHATLTVAGQRIAVTQQRR
jgi:hypothetical protein